MKIHCAFLLCCLLAAASPPTGFGEDIVFRSFTTSDGRSLNAAIKDYNPHSKKIQIKRADGKLIWTRPTVFSELDQEYIRKWIAVDQFMLSTKFRIKGTSDKNSRSKNLTQVVYEITLENKTDFPLKDLRIEYRSFILKKGLNRARTGQKDTNRVAGGQLHIAEIPAGKKVTRKTQSANLSTTFKEVQDSTYIVGVFDRYELKSSTEKLEGFWIKVYGPEVDGKPAIREWCNPPDTSENFAWQDLTPSRQTASPQKSESDPAEEIERLTKTYERNPSPKTARNIGYAYMWSLKPPNIPLALEWYEKAAKENNVAACRGLAGIYSSFYGHTQYYSLEKTIKYAQQALSIEPDGHTAHRMMAKAYAVDGQFDKAVEHQEKALEFLRPHRGKGSVDSHISAMEKTLELYKNKKVK